MADPFPKERQTRRSQAPYRRKVASPKQWAAIIAQKAGPCRCCVDAETNGHDVGVIEFHHIVARVHGGDDLPENIVPLHSACHDKVTRRVPGYCEKLLCELRDAEYAYAVERGGEDYFERAYGLRYERAGYGVQT